MTPYIASFAFILAATPLAAKQPAYRLLDHLVVTDATHPDLRLREISALAWDAQAQVLLALSDRNDLYHLSLGTDPDRIALALVAQHRLTDEAGKRLRGRYFSAEGIATGEPGSSQIAILSEMPPRLAIFDRSGQRAALLPLPPELLDITRLRSEGNGLESLAWHPTFGHLFAPEAPLVGEPRRIHLIYNSDGPALAFHTGEAGATSIKSMETLPDGHLLVLERDRLDAATIKTFLRVIDPAACPVPVPCNPPAIRLDLPPPHDADFEGLAWLGETRFLLASDDRIEGSARTVFALIELDLHGWPPSNGN